LWKWADAQGLVFPDQEPEGEPAAATEGGPPAPLKRPPSAGRTQDRDQKRPQSNRGNRKRASKSEPDKDALALAERYVEQHPGWWNG